MPFEKAHLTFFDNSSELSFFQKYFLCNLHLFPWLYLMIYWNFLWKKNKSPQHLNRLSRWLDGKESTCQCKRHNSIPGSEESPGKGNSNPLQFSCLGNLKDIKAWMATVHGVQKSWTQLAIKQQHHLKSHWKEQLRTFENNNFSNISFEKC